VLAKRNQAATGWLIVLIAILVLPGCNAFGLRKQLQQLENENSRLLSEFRAERQRRETAERTTQQLELRLAESEKLLARQLQDGAPGRLSSLPGLPARSAAPGSFPGGTSNGSVSVPWDGTQGTAESSGNFRWQRRSD